MTNQSGDAIVGQANTGGAGLIQSSSLEGSTVDLATEFTNLITTQRAYSASARIITTADQMLQTLEQMPIHVTEMERRVNTRRSFPEITKNLNEVISLFVYHASLAFF